MGMSLAVHLVLLRCSLGRFAPCSNVHETWETPQLHLQKSSKPVLCMILNGHGMSVLATHLDPFISCGGYIYQTKQR